MRGGEMVAESWFGGSRLNSRNNSNLDITGKMLGILVFEVASLMSKVVNLWHSLDDTEIFKLRKEMANSLGLRRLVSNDENYLMDLALNEIIENFGILATSVARLGKKCNNPVYHRFEYFIRDPILNSFEWLGWEYCLKKMERKVQKMERFVLVTMRLTRELEVLAEHERTLRRIRRNSEGDGMKTVEWQKKVILQRQEVKNLRDMSPWVRTYDYVVRILLRSLLTILEKIKYVFRTHQMVSVSSASVPPCNSFSTLMSSVHPSDNNLCGFNSEPPGQSFSKSAQISGQHLHSHHHSTALHGKHPRLKTKQFGHVGIGPFKRCVSVGSNSQILNSRKPIGTGSFRFIGAYNVNMDKLNYSKIGSLSCSDKIYSKLRVFNTKHLLDAPTSTLGDAALSLHYANIIILIEKLVSAPHMICLDARDELYNMLPACIRNALRLKLKSNAKTWASSIRSASPAAELRMALVRILEWLAPLAHNMIRWQSDRNFEEQRKVSQSDILLVQTLHFANRPKTEAAIIELLLGLNYVCRIGRTRNKLAL
ncbi:hypothetical protein V6Z11_A09G161100 [Gossypium hirsutum]|uniref:Protein PSK SIMULATOR 1 n=1 Tax=Gossypium hirsutum TaxID=3635 RepID=A0A1U8HU62_GOSHI|nr:protein PSK SIMULATOR 1 [Gossypium hirsutum]